MSRSRGSSADPKDPAWSTRRPKARGRPAGGNPRTAEARSSDGESADRAGRRDEAAETDISPIVLEPRVMKAGSFPSATFLRIF